MQILKYHRTEAIAKKRKMNMNDRLTYSLWRDDHKTILESLSNQRTVMLYSGGKDCSIALYYLLIASREFHFEFETIGATYPNHIYSDAEIEKLSNFWLTQGVNIKWINPNDSDEILSAAATTGENPCNICRSKKRALLNDYLKNNDSDGNTVIVVSYTLWDIVSYSIEYLLGDIFSPNKCNAQQQETTSGNRFIQTSHRFYPFLKTKDNLSIFKPMLKYNDYEIKAAIEKENIPSSSIQCLYNTSRTKRVLFDYYRELGLSFDYNKVFIFFESVLKPYDSGFYSDLNKHDLVNIL